MEIQEIHRQLGQLEGRIERNESVIETLSELLEKVRDRVPPWVALIMTGMGAVIGSLLTMCR